MTEFRVGSATDVGQIRSNNQDSKLVADQVSVFAVADGMGGHQGGEVASAIAVETLEATLLEPTRASVVEAVREANRRIFSRASDTADLRGMGTTLVAIALVAPGTDGEEVAWVNVGDSRVYLLRDEELHQLSRDHSLVEDLRRGGQLTDEEAAVHPQRNILTRALGIDSEVEVDDGAVLPLRGDRFLLCSDGLFNEVDRDTLIATLGSIEDPEAAAVELVRLANAGGGRDNITCVVADVVDDGGRSDRAAAAATTAAATVMPGPEAGDAPLAPTQEMPAVTVAPDGAPEAVPPAATAEPEQVSPPTQPGLGPPPPPPVDVTAPVAPAAAPPPPGRAGFPTDEDHDAQPGDDDLPFGRGTTDLYEDMDKTKGRHRVVSLVVVLLVLVVVAGGAYAGLSWYANRTYFVGTQGEAVVIFQGQPGGFLIFDPSVEDDFSGEITVADLTGEARDAVAGQREFSSLANARSFVRTRAEPEPPATTEPQPSSTTTTEDEPTSTTERQTTTTSSTTTTSTPN